MTRMHFMIRVTMATRVGGNVPRVFIFLVGCGFGGLDTTPDPPVYDDPLFTEASAACNDEDARWTFRGTTVAWTGNGEVVLSTDGSYIERHPWPSVESAPDGTTDELELKLDVVPDWRDVTPGASTVFNCDEPELAGLLRVFVRGGDAVADCRWFGEASDRWATWEPESACATPLEAEETAPSG